MLPLRSTLVSPVASLLTLLSGLTTARAELLVYEPFDYQTHNDEVFGRLEGRNGGKGFAGPWQDTDGRDNDGHAFVFDDRGNPEDLYGGGWGQGKPTWDGKVDKLPTMGNYVGGSDWNGSGDRINSHRKLARSAGEMADGGVLWLSAVWHFPEQSYFAPVAIALTSKEGGIQGRGHVITNQGDGIGVGNGRDFRNGRMRLNAMCWQNGDDVSFKPVANPSSSQDNIIVLKFEFGETDTVSAWHFTEDQELTEEVFLQNAVSCSAKLDENTLDTLAFGTIMRGNAVDEFRIGTRFESVISGSIRPRQEVRITKQLHDPESDRYHLTWSSNPGEVYGVYLDEDLGGYQPCITAKVEASSDKGTTSFGPFDNPKPGNADLKFRIGLPDLTQPVLDRVWGNGTTVSLHFSEAMYPDLATDPGNYIVADEEGTKVPVTKARFHPGKDTIELTTAAPLKPATSYLVTTRKLTDRANLTLVEPSISFQTWDDDPNGVKVFVLAGQSNMVGRGWYDKGQEEEIGGVGSLRAWLKQNPKRDPGLLDADGQWQAIDRMKFCWDRAEPGGEPRLIQGDMTVGYGAGSDCIGPEYGFAWGVHQVLKDQPVLIIKAAWGGKSLHTDYCSPTAASQRDGRIGPYYLQMMKSVQQICSQLGELFPEFEGLGYQIAGFGWHQGYNDMLNPVMDSAYEANMATFIRDIRAEFGKPQLPVAIATTGHGGMSISPEERLTLAGQLAVADPSKHPEFEGTVFTVDSRPFQRSVEESPKSDGSHWHNNGETLWLIGKGMGDGMAEMLGQSAR